MNFARSLFSARVVWPVAAVAAAGPLASVASAQQPVTLDVQDAQNAQALLNQGKYDEAEKLYAGIPQKYPTSFMIPEAYFRLGYIYYLKGDYDKGVEALKKNFAAKNVSPEILELSYVFVPQLLSAKAAKMQPDDPARKPAFQAAVKEFDAFLQKFPKSEEVESANYGKARALYSIQEFEQAAAALKLNLQQFPKSPSLLDTKYMLALVLGSQANADMQKGAGVTAPAAYDEASQLLGDIIRAGSDIALKNDAQFQLGEMLASKGSATPDKEAKAKVLGNALIAYRAVIGKEQVIEAQKARLGFINQAKIDAGKRGDVAQFKRLQRFLDKEQEKAASLEERNDLTLASKIKSAQIYLSLERFDETRVLLHHIEPLIEDAEQKKLASYFIAVTYAAQSIPDKSVEAYDKFMAAYKGDPIAENLGLLVGLTFLAHNEPEKAIKYFDEQAKNYPKSKFTADATMRQALALIPLGRFDEALGVLQKFLATNPTQEQGASAELGVATIYQRTGKKGEALKTFINLRDKYAGTPEAEQATFWAGQLTMENGDPKKGLEELKKFIEKYPKSELVPGAMLGIGAAKGALGDKEGAIAAYKDLIAKYPDAEPSPIAFFQWAALHQKDDENAKVKEVMGEFTKKYPKNERLFSAYDYIAQINVKEKAPLAAIENYDEFIKERPDDPDAAKAYVKAAFIWRKYGEDQGPYLALNPKQRDEWNKGINNSITYSEKVLEKFPESSEVATAMGNLLATLKLQLRVKLKTDKDVEDYFQGFAKKFESKPATKNKILFAFAGYVTDKDAKKAFDIMKSAYDPKLVYTPADLDLYGTALLKNKQLDDAAKVFEKLQADYPIPAGTDLSKITRNVADAQSIALFGSAQILQAQNKTAEASAKFAQLKKDYPYSPKLLEADYGIAQGHFGKGELDQALKLLTDVAKSTTAPTNLRARAMILMGEIAEKKGDNDSAINNYIKVGALFPAEVELAPEGLWRGAQLIEKKLNK